MECPACRGKRVPCAVCRGKRAIVGPCASPNEQARQDIGIRMIGAFEPWPPDPPVIELRIPHHAPARATMDGVKRVAEEHPGDHELKLIVEGREFARRPEATLTLGPEWRYDGSEGCVAALSEFGEAFMPRGR